MLEAPWEANYRKQRMRVQKHSTEPLQTNPCSYPAWRRQALRIDWIQDWNWTAKNRFEDLEKPTDKGLLAHSGIFSHSYGFNILDISFEKSWIINSKATDHMTKTCLHILPYPSSRKIITADGSLKSLQKQVPSKLVLILLKCATWP